MKIYPPLKPQIGHMSERFNNPGATKCRMTQSILRYSKPKDFCNSLERICFRVANTFSNITASSDWQKAVNRMSSGSKDQVRNLVVRILDENTPLSSLPQSTKLKLAKNVVIPLKKAFYDSYDTILRALLRQHENLKIESEEELVQRRKISSKNLFNTVLQHISLKNLSHPDSTLKNAL